MAADSPTVESRKTSAGVKQQIAATMVPVIPMERSRSCMAGSRKSLVSVREYASCSGYRIKGFIMYPIGQAAERSGVTIETIRYYEREGIVPKPDRTASGRRTYTESDIARLRFVKRCRDLGFPVSSAKSLLGLTDGSQTSCTTAQSIATSHLVDVKGKMSDLKRMESALVEMIDLCGIGDEPCPILEHLLSDRDT